MHLFQLNNSLTNKCQFKSELFSNNLRFLIVGIIGSSISIASFFIIFFIEYDNIYKYFIVLFNILSILRILKILML